MKIARVARVGLNGPEPRLVLVDQAAQHVIDLRHAETLRLVNAGSSPRSARRQAALRFPSSLSSALESAEFATALAAVGEASEECAQARLGWEQCTWLPPIDPPRFRDFMSYEQHNLTAALLMGSVRPPEVIYKLPVYYKGNHLSVVATDAEISWPAYSDFMDFELELGFVIGAAGIDLDPTEAERCIFGVTVLNDFSARDRQVEESSAGLGPAKGKDFATAVGPWITTVDELDLNDLAMTATVNGEQWAHGSSGSAMWSAAELVAYASSAEALTPGELLGSGTLGGGCGVEAGRRIIPGDLIELEVAGIGTLRNRIGEPRTLRWEPIPRQPGVTVTGGLVTGPTRPMTPRLDAPPPPVVLDLDNRVTTAPQPASTGPRAARERGNL